MSRRRHTRQVENVDADDACPFPPGVDLPRKSGLGSVLGFVLAVDWRIFAPMLSLGLILLVSGLLISPPIPFTSPKEPSTWSITPRQYVTYYRQATNWTPKYTNQIVHSGNLVLKSGEEYIIENCTYFLQGTLLASGNSSLVVRNAEVWVKNTEQWDPYGPFPLPADMIFANSSKFEVVDSSIVGEWGVDIVLLDDSTADIRHSNLTLTILSGDDNSRIQADNSIFGFACVASNASCSLSGSQVDFLAPGFQIWHSYYMTASSYDIGPWVDSRTMVINSTINQLGVRAVNTTIRVRGSLAGGYPTWSPSSICSGGRWFNVSLVDSNMGRIVLWADDSSLEITDNEDLNALVVRGGSVTLSGVSLPALIVNSCTTSVNGSVLSSLDLLGDSDVSVKDSLTESIYLQDFTGALVCDQVRSSRLWGSSVNGTVSGDLYIPYTESDLDVLQWSVKLRREFDVLAEAGGFAANGVALSLMNGNTTLWSGSTDASGRADFNVTYYHLWWLGPGIYADDNSTSTLTLNAELGDEVQMSNVTVESSSPIVISFKELREAPLWFDRSFLLFSGILIVVCAFAYALLKRARTVDGYAFTVNRLNQTYQCIDPYKIEIHDRVFLPIFVEGWHIYEGRFRGMGVFATMDARMQSGYVVRMSEYIGPSDYLNSTIFYRVTLGEGDSIRFTADSYQPFSLIFYGSTGQIPSTFMSRLGLSLYEFNNVTVIGKEFTAMERGEYSFSFYTNYMINSEILVNLKVERIEKLSTG